MTTGAVKTTKIKAGARVTIYRKCACGETAHDFRLIPTETGGRYVYACRNCRSPIFCPTKVRP